MSLQENKLILGADDISRSITRIAFEIVERNHGSDSLVILGIPTRGQALAKRIGKRLSDGGTQVETGTLDITMYRDDLGRHPVRVPHPTWIPDCGIDGKTVVLVDDVLFSGRTVRAALDALNDIGRPENVQLAVLVDRGHRQLPIRPDYVGKNLPTARSQIVEVLLEEYDGEDGVRIGGQA